MGPVGINMGGIKVFLVFISLSVVAFGDTGYGPPPPPYHPPPPPPYHPPSPPFHPPPGPYHAQAPSSYPAKKVPAHPVPIAPAAPSPYPAEPSYSEEPSPYTYEYGVHDDYTGTTFNAEQHGDGHSNVEGSYSVALPDGRVQHVSYHSDPYGGYVADVTYEGTAQYVHQQPPHQQPPPEY